MGIDQTRSSFLLLITDRTERAETIQIFTIRNGELRGIKRSLFEGGIRVPLIVRWPGHLTPGTENDWIGGFQDVLPTLAELAGGEEGITQEIDGISFVPAMKQESSQPDHEHLYWAFYEGGGCSSDAGGEMESNPTAFPDSGAPL